MAMSAYERRVRALAVLFRGLPSAGVVHHYSRLTIHWADYVKRFVHQGRIDGWEISRAAATPDSPRWQDTYRVRRFLVMNDAAASDLAFQASLDEAIRELGDGADLTLEDGTPWGWVAGGLSFPTIVETDFGGVLCHYAEGQLPVTLYHHDV
jgi:hypothetical protein